MCVSEHASVRLFACLGALVTCMLQWSKRAEGGEGRREEELGEGGE